MNDHQKRFVTSRPTGDTFRSITAHRGRIIKPRMAGEGVGAPRIRDDASQSSIGSAHKLAADRDRSSTEFILGENRCA